MPNWVYDLITAIEQYEDNHGPHGEDWPCFAATLDRVPPGYREKAAAIAAYIARRGDEATIKAGEPA